MIASARGKSGTARRIAAFVRPARCAIALVSGSTAVRSSMKSSASDSPTKPSRLYLSASSARTRIGVPQDFAPYGSVTADLQLQGLDIEVAKLVAGGVTESELAVAKGYLEGIAAAANLELEACD